MSEAVAVVNLQKTMSEAVAVAIAAGWQKRCSKQLLLLLQQVGENDVRSGCCLLLKITPMF